MGTPNAHGQQPASIFLSRLGACGNVEVGYLLCGCLDRAACCGDAKRFVSGQPFAVHISWDPDRRHAIACDRQVPGYVLALCRAVPVQAPYAALRFRLLKTRLAQSETAFSTFAGSRGLYRKSVIPTKRALR